jgi:hypothetical protein
MSLSFGEELLWMGDWRRLKILDGRLEKIENIFALSTVELDPECLSVYGWKD